jgi:hypothetical protein
MGKCQRKVNKYITKFINTRRPPQNPARIRQPHRRRAREGGWEVVDGGGRVGMDIEMAGRGGIKNLAFRS